MGIVSDNGAFGTLAWLDDERGYALVIMMEATSTLGKELGTAVAPVVQALFDD